MEDDLFVSLLDESDLKCIQKVDSLLIKLGAKPMPKDFIILPTSVKNIV